MTDIIRLDHARQALAEANTLPDIKQVRDKAEALRAYARSAGMNLAAQNEFAALKLAAERKAGQLLADELNHGDQSRFSCTSPSSQRATLDSLGITKDASSRWQRLARIPDADFNTFLANTLSADRELTQHSALKLAGTYNWKTAKDTTTPPATSTHKAYATNSIDDELANADRAASADYLAAGLVAAINTGINSCNERQAFVWRKHTGVNEDGTQGEAWSIPAIAAATQTTREYIESVWIRADNKVLRAIVASLLNGQPNQSTPASRQTAPGMIPMT